MSAIYISEPPTHGRVVVSTTSGDLDVELWSKETPKACRNFIQLCLDGYYDGCEFFRVVPRFIVQTGDPTNTGHGGESSYGEPFKDEFHSRLKFSRRGLVGMANAGPNDNKSQFFITLDKAEELTRKHTLFAKITGDSVFNLLKIGESEVDEAEKPVYTVRILKTDVLDNPFPDVAPRVDLRAKRQQEEEEAKQRLKQEEDERKRKAKIGAKRDLKLLSFGEEAEEEQTDTPVVKIKSSHDVLKNDPRLRAQSTVSAESSSVAKRTAAEARLDDHEASSKRHHESPESDVPASEEEYSRRMKESFEQQRPRQTGSEKAAADVTTKSVADKLAELKEQSRRLREELKKGKSAAKQPEEAGHPSQTASAASPPAETRDADPADEHELSAAKYKQGTAKKLSPAEREAQMLAMLEGFKKKLTSAPTAATASADQDLSDSLVSAAPGDWMHHTLEFDTELPKRVVDPSKENDEDAIFNERNEKAVLGYGHASSLKIEHKHHHRHHHDGRSSRDRESGSSRHHRR